MPKRDSRRPAGRPKKAAPERRKTWFTLKVTDEEKEVIRAKADLQNLPAQTYVRRLAYRGWVRNTRVGAALMRIAQQLEAQATAIRERRLTDSSALQATLDDAVRELREQIPHL